MEYDYKKMSDKELVEKAGKGDQIAYRAIYERYAGAVRLRVSSFFNWGADIDDVVSVTFQKFFSRMETYDTSRELIPWLMTIANRTALDHLQLIRREEEKKEGMKSKNAESTDEGMEILSEINPEEEIINGEEHERLMGFIEELPDRYREVMKKYMIEELEYEKIAEELDLELNTVRTRIHRGKEKLAEMMLRGEVK
jgi:RNA polymerase sigma-70 factor (ECF subfamily)